MLARPQLTILKPKVRQYPQAVLCQTATTGTQPRKARLRALVKAPVYAEDLRTLDASLSFQVIDQWDLIVGKTVNRARVMGSEQCIFSLFTLQGLYYWKHSLELLISLLNEWMNRHILRPLNFSTDRSDDRKAKPIIRWFSFLPFFLVSFSFSCSRYQCISAQVVWWLWQISLIKWQETPAVLTQPLCCRWVIFSVREAVITLLSSIPWEPNVRVREQTKPQV